LGVKRTITGRQKNGRDLPSTRKFISTHRTFAEVSKSIRDGKGNAFYLLDDALQQG
jgi:hypothetical protein